MKNFLLVDHLYPVIVIMIRPKPSLSPTSLVHAFINSLMIAVIWSLYLASDHLLFDVRYIRQLLQVVLTNDLTKVFEDASLDYYAEPSLFSFHNINTFVLFFIKVILNIHISNESILRWSGLIIIQHSAAERKMGKTSTTVTFSFIALWYRSRSIFYWFFPSQSLPSPPVNSSFLREIFWPPIRWAPLSSPTRHKHWWVGTEVKMHSAWFSGFSIHSHQVCLILVEGPYQIF